MSLAHTLQRLAGKDPYFLDLASHSERVMWVALGAMTSTTGCPRRLASEFFPPSPPNVNAGAGRTTPEGAAKTGPAQSVSAASAMEKIRRMRIATPS